LIEKALVMAAALMQFFNGNIAFNAAAAGGDIQQAAPGADLRFFSF
jgi:hypothetical protein